MDNPIFCNIHKRSDVDSCQVCEENNPIKERSFRGVISFPLAFLTCDGETDEEDGWKMIEGELHNAIRNLRPMGDMGAEAGFTEWEEE